MVMMVNALYRGTRRGVPAGVGASAENAGRSLVVTAGPGGKDFGADSEQRGRAELILPSQYAW
jgi:hypothetical protein